MSSRGHETEIKLPMPHASTARDLLRRAGFRVVRRRVFESNTVFDTADLSLRESGRLLRIRVAGRHRTLTYKGVAKPGPHKSRQELEFAIAKPDKLAAIFAALGYQPVFRYEKYRTEFRQGSRGGIIMLDETPVGTYLELEGQPSWIDRTARRLGFSQADYLTASYGRLYLAWCKKRGRRPSNMVFRAR